MQRNRWHHPGDNAIQRQIPFIQGPVDFLRTIEQMRFESSGSLADRPGLATFFHEFRGRRIATAHDLPWLDVDKAVFIAVNRLNGDDLAIALDYRTGSLDPRVVANYWQPEDRGCLSREVSATFTQFARALRLEGGDSR
jgi:hypothetical protein